MSHYRFQWANRVRVAFRGTWHFYKRLATTRQVIRTGANRRHIHESATTRSCESLGDSEAKGSRRSRTNTPVAHRNNLRARPYRFKTCRNDSFSVSLLRSFSAWERFFSDCEWLFAQRTRSRGNFRSRWSLYDRATMLLAAVSCSRLRSNRPSRW